MAMIPKVPLAELSARMERFRTRMDMIHPDWELCVIFSRINQYYFTGTMQDGMLLIPRCGEPELFVRRSYERALDESLFPAIRPMGSFRDAVAVTKDRPGYCIPGDRDRPHRSPPAVPETFPGKRGTLRRQGDLKDAVREECV